MVFEWFSNGSHAVSRTRKRLEALERQICSALERKEAPEPEEPEQERLGGKGRPLEERKA